MMVNLSKINSEGGFTLLPPGEYRVFLYSSEAKQSTNGKDFINCEFKIAEGDYKGNVVFDRLFFTESSLWRLKQFAQAVQFPHVDDEEGFETSNLFSFARGKVLVVHVFNEPYVDKEGNQKKSNKVDAFKVSEGGGSYIDTTDKIPF